MSLKGFRKLLPAFFVLSLIFTSYVWAGASVGGTAINMFKQMNFKHFTIDDAGGESSAYNYFIDSDYTKTPPVENYQCSHCSLAIFNGVAVDDGIDNDFSDPTSNSPYNSGIQAYFLSQLIPGLNGFVTGDDGPVDSPFNSNPNYDGADPSGPNDDIRSPVRFRGNNTGILVSQRSYADANTSFVILEYTFQNPTGSPINLKVGQIGDFDTNSGSTDDKTFYDASSMSVGVQDDGYTGQEKYYTAGIAVIGDVIPHPTVSALSYGPYGVHNYVLEKKQGLSLVGNTYEANRIGFFNKSSAFSNDQDGSANNPAAPSSEKEVAIAADLGSIPAGQSKTIAFCYVAIAPGGGFDSAKAKFIQTVSDCRNFYKTILGGFPFCGNGVVDTLTGESCDPDPNDTSFMGSQAKLACTSQCKVNVCGDGDLGISSAGFGSSKTFEECDLGDLNGLPTSSCTNLCKRVVKCGDGVKGGDEECDLGAQNSNQGACTKTCKNAVCGDSFVQTSLGEECDLGTGNGPTGGCDTACKFIPPPSSTTIAVCGNGTIEVPEECDKGSANSDTEDCTTACKNKACGDGLLQPGEECDDGNKADGDGCTQACQLEVVCGNGKVQAGEECDDGDKNSDTGTCTKTCKKAVCGDGFVQYLVEECDDGNTSNGDACNKTCKQEYCGDGVRNNATAVANQPAQETEQCDDGNIKEGDGCNKKCLLENATACGNGTVEAGEQCDDGNTADSDGCSKFCQLENISLCGNGALDKGEQCDDGNKTDGDGCSAICTKEVCGDHIQQNGEECDFGETNTVNNCSGCKLSPSTCGNAILELGEQCDDGNTSDGDTCTSTCQLVTPVSSTTLATTCANKTHDSGEQCDDGNQKEGDGCDSHCQLEGVTCGDKLMGRGESCDDGNAIDKDGCDASCKTELTLIQNPPPAAAAGCSLQNLATQGGSLGALLSLVSMAIIAVRRFRIFE